MMSIEDRLRTVVSLLPPAAQPRFAAPLAEGESTDTRLVEAVHALAKVEGLIGSTREAVARAKARVQIATAPPFEPVSLEPTPAERMVACKNPQQQTAGLAKSHTNRKIRCSESALMLLALAESDDFAPLSIAASHCVPSNFAATHRRHSAISSGSTAGSDA